MSIYLVLYFLLIHLMADAAFQTRKQTNDKAENNWLLVFHSLTVGIILTAATLFFKSYSYFDPALSFHTTYSYEWIRFVILFVSTFVTHYIIDKYASKITSYFWNTDNRYDYFVAVQIDKFLHIAILFVTLDLLFFNTF